MADLRIDGEAYAEAVVKDAVYFARNDSRTIDSAAEDAASTLNPLIWSDHFRHDGPLEWFDSGIEGEEPYQTHGRRRMTWKELCEEQEVKLRELQPFVTFVNDLDRCSHGRHEGDECGTCSGPSKGNMWMQDIEACNDFDPRYGARLGLGHTLGGQYSYFLRRPPERGMNPVAMQRVDRETKELIVVEFGERE